MNVLFETKGPIAYVTINRPSCSTPATSKPTNAWPRCGQKFREDASLRVGILIGVGDRASCARSDIKSNYIAHRREEPHNLLLQVLLEGNAATLLHLDKMVTAVKA